MNPMTSTQKTDRIYIGGEWGRSTGKEMIDVFGAATGQVIGSVPAGTKDDVARAVRAARAAFSAWSSTPARERAARLRQLRAVLADREEEIARTVASEVGSPLKIARSIQVGLPLRVIESFAVVLDNFEFEHSVGTSLVVREPIGVVGAITPWNYPLHQTVAKVAAALAAGCTVVHKPSEVAPFSAVALAEAVGVAGFPNGVYNLVTGTGTVVGEAIASHPDVDMVSFTGSTRAGKRVAQLAAETVKRVALELGGKSANVILEDADLTRAVTAGVNNAFLNSGQTCNAWTRLLVPGHLQEQVIQIAVTAADRLSIGDPLSETTRLGPLASAAQLTRVRNYIEQGLREGARLVIGGTEPPEGFTQGYYVRPTIFADVRPQMTIAREEIFGPVLCIMPYQDESDAQRMANDSIYGLAGAVWSNDDERALDFARRMRTGQVDINGARFNEVAPFGGYKQSGVGRELGRYGLEEFLEVKAIQL